MRARADPLTMYISAMFRFKLIMFMKSRLELRWSRSIVLLSPPAMIRRRAFLRALLCE